MKSINNSLIPVLAAITLMNATAGAETFPVWQDTYSVNGLVTKATGSSPTLLVGPTQSAYIKFNLAAATFPASQVTGARLVVYLPNVMAAGTLDIYANSSEFSEDVTSRTPAPTQDATLLGSL